MLKFLTLSSNYNKDNIFWRIVYYERICKPDLEVVKIRVEENFADNNTTVYDFEVAT